MDMKEINILSNKIIGFALEVHKELGPGLLESVYQKCLEYELKKNNLEFAAEKQIPVIYKEIALECGFRADIIVEKSIILEIKAVEKIMPIHEAQLMNLIVLSIVILLAICIEFTS